jgi:hypothetical protein
MDIIQIVGIAIYVAICITLIMILYISYRDKVESYMNVPEMIDLTKKKHTDSSIDELNVGYRHILQYISKNPEGGYEFIKDIKDKFFEPDTEIKRRIDFSKLADMYRPVFKSM